MCSSLPYNDPLRSVIDSNSNAGEDAVMTALTGTSPAQSHPKMDGLVVAPEDSGIDSQGFGALIDGICDTMNAFTHSRPSLYRTGKLALSDLPAPASTTTPRPAHDGERPPTSPLTGQKRKEPMSRFSDSSIDAGSSAVIEPSPAKMPPPPPPIRKDIPRVKAVDAAVVSESSDDREPSTAEDDIDDSAAVQPASPTKDDALAAATGDIALEKATETPPSVSEADVEAVAGEEEEEGPGKRAPARKARPSRGAAAKRAAPTTAATTRGRKRPSDPPRVPADDAEAEEADAEAEPDTTTKAKPELTGIAATVKNRRRKVAKYA